ncbi:MAG: manganese efflux pump [Candidatus Eisenbacteria sp.]|nr:manganese efflux pump [Candidatus Eisenbacteria bacterium]
MDLLEILLIAIALAMDAFVVSLAAGTSRQAQGRRSAFRLSFHFGLFHFIMPVIGWVLGTRIAALIAWLDHWMALGLLVFVGIRMIRSGMDPAAESRGDPLRGSSLIALSLAVSIDALAVGFSLAMLQVSIWLPAAVIAAVTAVFTLLAFWLGNRLSTAIGRRMEAAGGVILILIGLRILLVHMLG